MTFYHMVYSAYVESNWEQTTITSILGNRTGTQKLCLEKIKINNNSSFPNFTSNYFIHELKHDWNQTDFTSKKTRLTLGYQWCLYLKIIDNSRWSLKDKNWDDP